MPITEHKVSFQQFQKYLKNSFFTFEAYEKVAKENLKIIKENRIKKKLSKKDEQYSQFICDSLFKIDTNISELAKGLKLTFAKKNLMPSVFLTRGLVELVFFNIYIAFKSYVYIKKNDLKGLVNLICRSSLASDVDTINSDFYNSESAIFKKIIKGYRGKRIHINDCIRFYKKASFKEIIKTKEKNQIESFKILEAYKRYSIKNDFIDLNETLENHDCEFDIYIYDMMCEIIHPTAIILNDAKDKKTQIHYREILGSISGSYFFMFNVYAIFYKIFFCHWFLENKVFFIKNFNHQINSKNL